MKPVMTRLQLITLAVLAVNGALLLGNVMMIEQNQKTLDTLRRAIDETRVIKDDYIRLFCTLAGPDARDIEAHEGGRAYRFSCPPKDQPL